MSSSSSSSLELNSDSLPYDVTLRIASSLTVFSRSQVTDLCSLGSCSRYFRSICDIDALWITLINKRWPSMILPNSSFHKGVYANRHKEVAREVSSVLRPVTKTEKVSARDYLKVVEDLNSLKLQFEDVRLTLFKPVTKHNNNNVLVNLVGLHYSMFYLGISGNDVREALQCSGISAKTVCVSSFTLGRLFFGLRIPDNSLLRVLSLEELTMDEHEEVRCVLTRGTVEQVFRGRRTTMNWRFPVVVLQKNLIPHITRPWRLPAIPTSLPPPPPPLFPKTSPSTSRRSSPRGSFVPWGVAHVTFVTYVHRISYGLVSLSGDGLLCLLTGWREIYINQHKKIMDKVSTITHFVKDCSQNESIEVSDYLKAVVFLGSAELGFEDIKLFLFSVNTTVLMNLIGLHYSIFCLQIPVEVVNEALDSCQVSTREVCVFSFRLGRWFFGFRLPDERSSRRVSLGELTTSNGEQLRTILNQGVLHDVLRVHIISPARFNVGSSAALPDPRVPN